MAEFNTITEDITISKETDVALSYQIFTTNDNRVNVPKDVRAWNVTLRVKKNIDDVNTDAIISVITSSCTLDENGNIAIPITRVQTKIDAGQYFFQIKVKDDSGDVFSIHEGKFYITEDVVDDVQ